MTDRTIRDPMTGQLLTFLETGADTDGRTLRAEVRLETGGFVPRHLHFRQDESLDVLAGSVRVRTRGEDRVLGPGETSVVARRRIHRVANAGPTEARFVLEVHPAGHIEQTMRSMFAIGRALRPLARLRRRSQTNRPLWLWAALAVAAIVASNAFIFIFWGDGAPPAVAIAISGVFFWGGALILVVVLVNIVRRLLHARRLP